MEPYYDDGKGIVIYHGDCREILPTLPKVDLVLTDPPYGIEEGAAFVRNGGQNIANGAAGWNRPVDWLSAAAEVLRFRDQAFQRDAAMSRQRPRYRNGVAARMNLEIRTTPTATKPKPRGP